MYLQAIDLFGFKSFAAKTRLEFHRGVTAIVGPNGCGKSNVLDAIRWVLGEQSAKALRGGEMADVIFSGTDSRQPFGMAEVSMTFAECEEQLGLDWHEVTITRRVYRDGGSDYFLNKTPCRLRDIHELFMDTGIGRSAYSIMEQGKIDLILSSRPEDRRAIFEEAAGITKYKAQKKEALRKLEATEANLLRLADIIKEVKRQIGSLQRQAGKARRYQALLADLRLLETHSAKRQFDELEGQRTRVGEELVRLEERLAQCQGQIDEQEAVIGAQRDLAAEIEQRITQARQVVNDFRTRISNHENRILFNEERAEEFAGLLARYRTDVAGAEEKLRIAEGELLNTDDQLQQITALLATELRVMEGKQELAATLNNEHTEIERTLADLGHAAAVSERRIATLRGEIASVTHHRELAEARLTALHGEQTEFQSALEIVRNRREEAQSALNRAGAEQERITTKLSNAEQELRDKRGAMNGLEEELRNTQRLLSEKQSRRDVLQQLNEGGEGFSEGTQAILRGLDNPEFFGPAIVGALARFIEARPEHVSAVEAALGTHLQTIVMKDAEVAHSMVQTLVTNKAGKASLALREFASDAASDRTAERGALPAGAIGWLADFVSINGDDTIRRLADQFLQRTVLVSDLQTAFDTAMAHRGELRWVTLAGEVLDEHGILSGGATGEAPNSFLQRKNQIAELEAEAHEVRGVLQNVTSRRDLAVMDIEAAQAQVEEARDEKQDILVEISTVRSNLAIFERELKETERKQQTLAGERDSTGARQRDATARLEVLERDVQSEAERLENLQARRRESQQKLDELRSHEAAVAGDLNELRIKVATERQRHTSLHHQRQPLEARLVELSELIAQRHIDIEEHEKRRAAMTAENAEISANLERLHIEMGSAEEEVGRLAEERHGISARIEQLGNTLRILRQQLSENHDQRSRLEVKQTQCEMRLTSICEHIQKRYQTDLREFQRDLHGLRVAVRDQAKRLAAGTASAASGESSSDESPISERNGAAEQPAPKRGRASNEPEPPESFTLDWDQIEALVQELDQRLDAMGPVNIDAIQEYDELEERHTFLEKQNTDLANARTELIGVIAKINQTTEQLFAETFEQIRGNFAEMFTELFGGGKANLLLVDDSDPLESGIDIIARPPGKQLQSISLLSGGERTMTAVALLFSIYMVKPSPFCVLDEMDAPLDESNINRFIKILDRFTAQSQFLVISHNKRTIARADAIYGVTMEEQGISRLVGVTFSRREESHAGRDIIGTRNPAPMPSVAETFGKHGELHSERLHA